MLEIFTDDGHVVRVVEEPAPVELPARAASRRLDLGAGGQVRLAPPVQQAHRRRRQLLHLAWRLSVGRADTRRLAQSKTAHAEGVVRAHGGK